MSSYSDKTSYYICASILLASILEGVQESRRVKKELADREKRMKIRQERLEQDRKNAEKMFKERLDKNLQTLTKKEVNDYRVNVQCLLNRIPERREKELIPVSEPPKPISIEKVRKMMEQYGKTVEDFRRDFPNAIIID